LATRIYATIASVGSPPFDQPFRRRRLHHSLGAGPAGIFGAVCHDHPELRGDNVEPLRGLLADHMHGRPTAGATGVDRLDRYIDVRQMGGQRAPVGATLLDARPGGRRILLVFAGLICSDGLFDILKCQPQLLRIELLRPSTKLRALQLTQKMAQPIVRRWLRCGVAHARN
jgi:hypothetical protein